MSYAALALVVCAIIAAGAAARSLADAIANGIRLMVHDHGVLPVDVIAPAIAGALCGTIALFCIVGGIS